jgi:hypothetical protein
MPSARHNRQSRFDLSRTCPTRVQWPNDTIDGSFFSAAHHTPEPSLFLQFLREKGLITRANFISTGIRRNEQAVASIEVKAGTFYSII